MPKMWKRDGHKADKIKQNPELCRVQPRPREKASAIAPIVCADGSKITSIQSRMDGKINKNSSTGVNGVTKRENGKYFAYINFKRKQIGLGMYDKLEDAIAARKKAEELIYAPYLEAHEGWQDDLKKPLKS